MNKFYAPGTRRFSGISLLALLVLCALALSNLGCDGGVGEVAAIDGVATDATATAAAVTETAADAVTETAIAGSTDVALDLGGDMATVEPFSPVLETGGPPEEMVAGLSAADPDGTTITELDNKTTGDLQMMTIATRTIYQAEKVFLDVQNKRLILQAIENKGDAPTWGFFKLGDKAISDLEQAKKLAVTGSDQSPMVFEHLR